MQKLRRNKVEERFIHVSHYKMGKSHIKIKVEVKLKIVLLNWKDYLSVYLSVSVYLCSKNFIVVHTIKILFTNIIDEFVNVLIIKI